ncbi:sce7725 family protein [Lysinibacillus sp. 54212]|uniref:sce7725 family protein n=1 Tax=Lysinibacillus sp. 54212 TaxID=3119829 RepID=UPI002FC6BB63
MRGRQFDLIAIRELLEKELISKEIVPIIEPVKLSSTLISTLNLFIEKEREVLVIQNPCVGNFSDELEGHDLYENYIEILKSEFIIVTHYFDVSSIGVLSEIASGLGKSISDLAIIHKDISLLPEYKSIYSHKEPKYNIVPEEQSFRRRLREKNLVCLKDEFIKQKRNTDYSLNVDEFFSEEHLHFNREGLVGFSDYSVVGNDYSEGGFAPYAIALHIVYFSYDAENESDVLRIRHFVSDSNDDIRDPALKCSEALSKLASWITDIKPKKVNTYAIEQLLEHHKKGSYPGLPSLKKLSLMHHIELVDAFLKGKI